MSKHLIQVAFAGSALDDGTMDVKMLAPALLSLGELVEEANNLLGKPRSKVTVNVKSDFKTGSVEVAFEVIQSVIGQTLGFIASGSNLGTILETIGFLSTTGLNYFRITKLLKGKPIKSKTVIENGLTRIETTDSFHEIKVAPGVIEMYKHPPIRKAAQGMIGPLELPEVEEFQVKENGQVIEIVEKEEAPYFCYEQRQEEVLSENTVKVWVEIISVCFELHRKWQLVSN